MGIQKISAIFETQALHVCKAYDYVLKRWILLAGTSIRKVSSVTCWLSSICLSKSKDASKIFQQTKNGYGFSVIFTLSINKYESSE